MSSRRGTGLSSSPITCSKRASAGKPVGVLEGTQPRGCPLQDRVPDPGKKLFAAIRQALGKVALVAEDLAVIHARR